MKSPRLVRFVEEHAGLDGVEMKGPWGRVTKYVTENRISGQIFGPGFHGSDSAIATVLEGVIYEVMEEFDGELYPVFEPDDSSEYEFGEREAIDARRAQEPEPEEDVAETPRVLRHKFQRERRREQCRRFDEHYPELD